MKTILIPSATLVSGEMAKIGKIPAIIYPINDKTVFEQLYQQYAEKDTLIKILLYEQSMLVQRKLAQYICKDVELQNIPCLKDLGYTIYCGLENVYSPVVINFADTIVMDSVRNLPEDTVMYANDYYSSTWTYFEEDNGRIVSVVDKKESAWKMNEMGKIFIGVFSISDPQFFRECLQQSFDSEEKDISSFYQAVMLYSQSYSMKLLKTDDWYDIGHVDTYNNSSLEVKARIFNHIIIDKNRGILKKTSREKEKFIGEIKWYLKLPADLEYVRPRIFSYSLEYESPYVKMEYYTYHTLHELFLFGDLEYHKWVKIFEKIKFLLSDFRRYRVEEDDFVPALYEMYKEKTVTRLNEIKSNERFRSFFENKIKINGKSYCSLNEVSRILEQQIVEKLMSVPFFCIIHGDLCFSNIMVDSNCSILKVIDPRGKFGVYDIYGDPRYELAKLFHSVDGKYDYIIKDQFFLNYDTESGEIWYSINEDERNYDLYGVMKDVLSSEIGDDLEKVELIEALLFLSMIPLHSESEKHQIVMLARGIEILDRVVDIHV